jgi:ATP phosphoribosyltransferase
MLKVAIPNKGALSEGAVTLLKEAGYKCKRSSRELVVLDKKNNIEFVFLRPRDIAVYVSNGIINLGITGRDLAFDGEGDVTELLGLNFGKSRFFYALPKEQELTPNDFDGLKIATSYPKIVKDDMTKRGLNVQVIKLDGAVEISIKLGVADVIADVVESGRTLVEAGLKTVGEPIMHSEAILIAKDKEILENQEVKKLIARIEGILLARTHAMVEYDVPKSVVQKACEITPGIEAPTISPLSNEDWVAVKSMVEMKDANKIMDELQDLGAKGIILTEIKTCRL